VAETPQAFDGWQAHQLAETSPVVDPSLDPSVGLGQHIFEEHCAICHTIRGISPAGTRGPDLTHLMTRQTLAAGELANTPDNLSNWISDAQAIKVGALMPRQNLSSADLHAVTLYLSTLN
jgi:cytochrome c oxidase subunit 2